MGLREGRQEEEEEEEDDDDVGQVVDEDVRGLPVRGP